MMRAIVAVAIVASGCARTAAELTPFPCAGNGDCPSGLICTDGTVDGEAPDRICVVETCRFRDDQPCPDAEGGLLTCYSPQPGHSGVCVCEGSGDEFPFECGDGKSCYDRCVGR
jgi:hypothetical protein